MPYLEGESLRAVVADFGIARAVVATGGEQLTETGLVVGTPAYMATDCNSPSCQDEARLVPWCHISFGGFPPPPRQPQERPCPLAFVGAG